MNHLNKKTEEKTIDPTFSAVSMALIHRQDGHWLTLSDSLQAYLWLPFTPRYLGEKAKENAQRAIAQETGLIFDRNELDFFCSGQLDMDSKKDLKFPFLWAPPKNKNVMVDVFQSPWDSFCGYPSIQHNGYILTWSKPIHLIRLGVYPHLYEIIYQDFEKKIKNKS